MSAAVASDRRITGAYWKDISCGRVPIRLIPWISRGGVEIFLRPLLCPPHGGAGPRHWSRLRSLSHLTGNSRQLATRADDFSLFGCLAGKWNAPYVKNLPTDTNLTSNRGLHVRVHVCHWFLFIHSFVLDRIRLFNKRFFLPWNNCVVVPLFVVE